MAFIYDEDGVFEANANPDSIVWQRLSSAHWEAVLKTLVTEHHATTDSNWSGGLIEDWDRIRGNFWQVVPREMLERLSHPLDDTQELVAAE